MSLYAFADRNTLSVLVGDLNLTWKSNNGISIAISLLIAIRPSYRPDDQPIAAFVG
jgi:hypothetical protein